MPWRQTRKRLAAPPRNVSSTRYGHFARSFWRAICRRVSTSTPSSHYSGGMKTPTHHWSRYSRRSAHPTWRTSSAPRSTPTDSAISSHMMARNDTTARAILSTASTNHQPEVCIPCLYFFLPRRLRPCAPCTSCQTLSCAPSRPPCAS